MKDHELLAPESVDEAVLILDHRRGVALVLAGGTDVMVRARRRLLPPAVEALVSLHRLPGLRGVRQEDGELVVGATTTATDLIGDPVIASAAPILATAADRMASPQIRNVATIGGNLANASPAGDLINPLLLLDARVVLVSTGGRREVMVHELFTGPGETVLGDGELLVEIRFGVPPPGRVFGFEKAGTRPAMECSVVTVGVAYTLDRGRFSDVRVAFGSCGPTPLRGRHTEAVLEGSRPRPEVIDEAVRVADRDLSPISDIRGSECYRRALAGVFLRRLLAS